VVVDDLVVVTVRGDSARGGEPCVLLFSLSGLGVETLRPRRIACDGPFKKCAGSFFEKRLLLA
jgi:hypothetical protein